MSRDTVALAGVVALGVVLLAVGGYMLYSSQQVIANAEEIDATVVDSTVDQRVNDQEDDEIEYVPSVTYRYEYDGEEYIGR